jgi:hypothetical protein
MASRTKSALLCVSALALCAARVSAQKLELSENGRSGGTTSDETEHARGSYAGVKPGGSELPPIAAKPGSTPAAISWPGFQMQPDGSSRVFLQTTAPLDVHAVLMDGKVVMELGDAHVVGETNRFALYTQYFNTPVTRVEIQRTGKRTTLVLTLRAQIEPQVSSAQAPSGFHFVYLDFAAGSYLAAPPVALTDSAPTAAAAPVGTPATAPRAYRPVAIDEPSHLEGEIGANGSVKASSKPKASASIDTELPPGMAKPKAKAGGKAKLSL